jgi:hypothetical protein
MSDPFTREVGNVKESAKCLQKLFKKFPHEDLLWKEIDLIMAALKKSYKPIGRLTCCFNCSSPSLCAVMLSDLFCGLEDQQCPLYPF